jgi:hypothetical protein
MQHCIYISVKFNYTFYIIQFIICLINLEKASQFASVPFLIYKKFNIKNGKKSTNNIFMHKKRKIHIHEK